MIILGIHDGHDASAALMRDGAIIAAAQEERFTDLKGDYGYPAQAIAHCLKVAGVSGKDLDFVGLSSKTSNPVLTYIKRNANFSVSDWVLEQEKFWKPRLFENKEVNYYELYKDRSWSTDKYYDYSGLLGGYMSQADMATFLERRTSYITRALGIPAEKLLVTNHETNHKCYALFSSRFRNEPVLILTTEGIGDEYNATVSVYRDGAIHTLKNLKENCLGHIYQYVTLILGMKPAQHEYKVMGLAPYSNDYETEKAYQVFNKILKVEGLEVKINQRPRDMYYTLRDELKHCRFDGIAGGVQKFLERVLCEWVANGIRETGIRKVVLAGGVAQNIKAMKSISELPEVEDIFVPPAAGDTSNSIGACYQVCYLKTSRDAQLHATSIQPLHDVYLGPAFNTREIFEFLRMDKTHLRYEIIEGVSNADIARLLVDGQILALMRGCMEFGLRSLGNRSIIADPSNPMVLGKINQKIKNRDFWMPFTPSILDTREKDYISNPKNLYTPFMTMAFDTLPATRSDFVSAMHPADLTARPQIVSQKQNPQYYDLLLEFQKLTGRGVILNTSFNLHGKAVVLGPREAIYTMDHSGLDALVMENILVRRRTST